MRQSDRIAATPGSAVDAGAMKLLKILLSTKTGMRLSIEDLLWSAEKGSENPAQVAT